MTARFILDLHAVTYPSDHTTHLVSNVKFATVSIAGNMAAPLRHSTWTSSATDDFYNDHDSLYQESEDPFFSGLESENFDRHESDERHVDSLITFVVPSAKFTSTLQL